MGRNYLWTYEKYHRIIADGMSFQIWLMMLPSYYYNLEVSMVLSSGVEERKS